MDKSTVCEVLYKSSADPNNDVRKTNEALLNQMANQKGFAFTLTNIIVDSSISTTIRHLAAIVLEIVVVKKHWDDTDEVEDGASPPVLLTEEEKASVRENLPPLLGDVNKKIRESVGNVMAKIAEKEFPTQWPNFMNTLISATRSNREELVHGGCKCLLSFLEVMDSSVGIPLAPELIPELLGMFNNPSLPLKLRHVALVCYCETLTMLGMNCYDEEKRVGIIIQNTLKEWLFCLASLLKEIPLTKIQHRLQTEAMKIVFAYLQFFPKVIEPHCNAIIDVLRNNLAILYPRYCAIIINGRPETVDEETNEDLDGYDSENGDEVGFTSEIVQLIELLRQFIVSSRKSIRNALVPNLNEVCYYVTCYMQMGLEQIENWESDPHQYVEDEDEESMGESIRNCGKEFLEEVSKSFRKGGAGATAVYSGSAMCLEKAQSDGEVKERWKLKEAGLLGLGQISKNLVQLYVASSTTSPFDLMAFLTMLHSILVDPYESVYLKGRAIWCASRFITEKKVPFEAALPFLSACLIALEESTPLPIKITACRALHRIITRIPREKSLPLLPQCISGICKLLNGAQDATVYIVLDTLKAALGTDKDLIFSVEPVLSPLMLALWEKQINNPMILDDILEIFTTLSSCIEAHASLVSHLLPPITGVLSSPDSHSSGVIETMISLLNVLIRNCPLPVPPQLLGPVFSSTLQIVIRTDDHSVMQAGAYALTWYVRKVPSEILLWSDTNGSATTQILSIVAKFLDPSFVDSAIFMIGPLIKSIVEKLSSHLDSNILASMLEAALRRMHKAKLPMLQNEFLLVFAALYNTHEGAIIDLADRVVLEGDVNGLEFLMSMWVELHPLLIRDYQRKVSILALLKIFALQNSRIESIRVKGELIEDGSKRTGMKTRSKEKANPSKYRILPLPVKIFSLIINEIKKMQEDRLNPVEEWDFDKEDDDGESDEEEEFEEFEDGGKSRPSPFADAEDYQHLLYPNPNDLDNTEENEGDDGTTAEEKEDPIFYEDVEQRLRDYIGGIMTTSATSVKNIVEHLSPKDKEVFSAVLSNK